MLTLGFELNLFEKIQAFPFIKTETKFAVKMMALMVIQTYPQRLTSYAYGFISVKISITKIANTAIVAPYAKFFA